jgi:DNA-binding NarL/FixJ family response regulator
MEADWLRVTMAPVCWAAVAGTTVPQRHSSFPALSVASYDARFREYTARPAARQPVAYGTGLAPGSSAMIRVLVADDHAMFREMLTVALPRSGDLEVVGEADNGRDLNEAVYRCRPDVLLLDYKMPYVNNFVALVTDLLARHQTTRVIVLSGFASADIAARAAAAGARGYILKAARLYAVADAIRTVMNGGIWIDPNLPRDVFDVFQRNSAPADQTHDGLKQLSRREREVLACVAQGSGNREIATKLAISEKTVKTHLTRIFAKLDVKNRVSAALVFHGGEGAGQYAGDRPIPIS